MIIRIDAQKVYRTLIRTLIFLVMCNLAVLLLKHMTGHDFVFGLVPMFSLYCEANIPTWFSAMLLFVSSVLLLLMSYSERKKSERRYWLLLSAVFLFLSIDELAQIHEMIGLFLYKSPSLGIFPQAKGSSWVLWGAPMCCLVGFVFFRFWQRRPPNIRLLFLLAGLFYVSGALGLEFVEIFYANSFGEDIGFFLLVTVEESLEMLGIIVFLRGLLAQLSLSSESIELVW